MRLREGIMKARPTEEPSSERSRWEGRPKLLESGHPACRPRMRSWRAQPLLHVGGSGSSGPCVTRPVQGGSIHSPTVSCVSGGTTSHREGREQVSRRSHLSTPGESRASARRLPEGRCVIILQASLLQLSRRWRAVFSVKIRRESERLDAVQSAGERCVMVRLGERVKDALPRAARMRFLSAP
jgi:hypothetical protein